MKSSFQHDGKEKIFITDCEGPISRNDNAMELSEFYIPGGDRFFSILSKYDDILFYIIKKNNYNPGSTLKLIFPFLIAFGANYEGIREYSIKNISLLRSIKKTLKDISSIMPVFIISTSYEPYIEALCDLLEFPIENAFCTRLNMNIFKLEEDEKRFLINLANEIKYMEGLEIPDGANSINEFPPEARKIVNRLNDIFWNELYKTKAGKIMDSINPTGGREKTKILIDIISRKHSNPENVIYVGDSITDMDALRYVREEKGVSISFNGNRYALMEADFGILSPDSTILLLIAETFIKGGREAVFELATQWKIDDPKIFLIDRGKMDYWITESESYRKKIRGEKVGSLG